MRRWLWQLMVGYLVVMFLVQFDRVLPVSAQSDKGAKALFYTETGITFHAPGVARESSPPQRRRSRPAPAPRVATQQASWYGMAYWVELKRNNVIRRIADPTSFDFRSGDRIRFQVMASTSGYLYVVNRGSSGRETLLFPPSQYNFNWLEARKPYTVPQSGDWILFDDQPGEENVLLVLSPRPLLEGMGEITPSSTLPPAASARFVSVTSPCGAKDLVVCGAKDLVVERDETQGEQATYVGGVIHASVETPEQFSLIKHGFRLRHR